MFPSPIPLGRHMDYAPIPGAGFNLTTYGAKWIEGYPDHDVLPTDYGTFGSLLANHSPKFGNGYHFRAEEALGCYQAQLYLACCSMCGGAAESILLSLSIAKKGDEEEILKLYGQATGRANIENLIVAGQNSFVREAIPNFLGLLKY
jgi:hypothetical protein